MRLVRLAVAAATAIVAAASANATVSTITFTNNVATFTNVNDPNTLTAGTYTDTYNFDLTGAGAGWMIAGDVASHFVTNMDGTTRGDVTFTSIALDGINYNLTSTGANEDYRLGSMPISPSAHSLVLTYNTTPNGTGSVYTGQLDITGPSPVPEPASWAMFLGGFGVLGGVMRQRRRPAVRFA